MTDARPDFDHIAATARRTLEHLDRIGGAESAGLRAGLELGVRVARVMTPDEHSRARALGRDDVSAIAARAGAPEAAVARVLERFSRT